MNAQQFLPSSVGSEFKQVGNNTSSMKSKHTIARLFSSWRNFTNQPEKECIKTLYNGSSMHDVSGGIKVSKQCLHLAATSGVFLHIPHRKLFNAIILQGAAL